MATDREAGAFFAAEDNASLLDVFADVFEPDGRFENLPIVQLCDTIDQMDARGDYVISTRQQIFARFSLSQRDRFQAPPLPGLADGGSYSTGNYFEATRGVGDRNLYPPWLGAAGLQGTLVDS